jgi:monofunctional biosynthetic peptidoglycan transglycosylase
MAPIVTEWRRRSSRSRFAPSRLRGYSEPVSKAPQSLSRGRRVWRIVWRVVLVLVLIPVVLVPLYRLVPPPSTLMLYEDVARAGNVQRIWLPLDRIAPVLVTSVMMSEDGRFCSHHGVDWDELTKVIDRPDDRPRGASTIAMQAAKNLFLWPSRSYLRKSVEMPIALYADFVWGKRREMEIYLNIVEWGPGIFGAEAAARHYFNRSAAALTASQAALLAATLPNPAERDPAHPSAGLRSIAGTIAARARMAGGYIDCLYPPARL